MSKNSRGKVPRNQRKTGFEVISHPPQLNGIELRHSVTLRYRATAAATTTVTFQNLLDTLLVATTATAGTDLFQTVKIRRVRIWGIGALGATSTAVTLEFSGVTTGLVGDQCIHTDVAMGVQPAYVDARPSPKALCSEYQLSSAANAFVMTVPVGAVIDLDLSFRSQFGTVNAAAQNALVGATAGTQYIRGLDGLGGAGTNYSADNVVYQI